MQTTCPHPPYYAHPAPAYTVQGNLRMPVSSSVSSTALFKVLGTTAFAGSLAACIGFLFLWPKSMLEGLARLFLTFVSSSLFGPLILVHLHHSQPGLFTSAEALAALYGMEKNLGLFFVATPALVIAGLPAWWIMGALVRLFERDGDGVLSAFARFIRRKLGGE